jgi:hypothetical protein
LGGGPSTGGRGNKGEGVLPEALCMYENRILKYITN